MCGKQIKYFHYMHILRAAKRKEGDSSVNEGKTLECWTTISAGVISDSKT